MKILTAPHPMLKTVCRSDFTIDVGTINAMFIAMKRNGGIGLAAPQVGIDARLFVTGWLEVFINPEIVQRQELILSDEGCLSIPGETFRVARHRRIQMSNGQWYEDLKAVVIQHELGHLDGRLINDP